MNKITRPVTVAALSTALVLTGVLSFGAASAFGASAHVFAPKGVTAGPGVSSEQKPSPHYKHNGKGLSYGSLIDSPEPAADPDLIAALATNGKEGYVLKTDLDRANGTAASEHFTSPADALAWQNSAEAHTDHAIPVYDQDGVTTIGEFVVEGN